jgi:hypothetical protein
MKAYIDESVTGDQKLFILGGYIASEEKWAASTYEWRELFVKLIMEHSLPSS